MVFFSEKGPLNHLINHFGPSSPQHQSRRGFEEMRQDARPTNPTKVTGRGGDPQEVLYLFVEPFGWTWGHWGPFTGTG